MSASKDMAALPKTLLRKTIFCFPQLGFALGVLTYLCKRIGGLVLNFARISGSAARGPRRLGSARFPFNFLFEAPRRFRRVPQPGRSGPWVPQLRVLGPFFSLIYCLRLRKGSAGFRSPGAWALGSTDFVFCLIDFVLFVFYCF